MAPYPVKIPAFQFYPADWRKDPAVQALSYHDRGVWFEILCIMHESSERGRLLLNGKPMPIEVLSRLLGLDKQVVNNSLKAILETGAGKKENGVIYSKRMVEDERIRRIRHEAGLKGGNPALVKQKEKAKVKIPGDVSPNQTSEGEDEVVDTQERGAGENPTLKTVLDFCAMGAAIPPECGTAFWNSMEGCGWIDSHHRPVRNWRTILQNYSVTWRANQQKGKQAGGNFAPRPPTIHELKLQRDAIESELNALRNKYGEGPLAPPWTEPDKLKRADLKKRIAEINSKIRGDA